MTWPTWFVLFFNSDSGPTIAWPHFLRKKLHSPPNGDFCPWIWTSYLKVHDKRARRLCSVFSLLREFSFIRDFRVGSYFCDRTFVHLIIRWQKSPKFNFQSQLSMSEISFIIFITIKIIRLGEQFIITHFLITSFFEVVHFLKLCPIFVTSWSNERKFNHKNN